MAALAVVEVEVAAEGAAAVVTSRAGLAACSVEMLGRIRRTDLSRLRRAGSDFVAIGAGETLSRAVVRVTERVAKGARVRARWTVGFLIVTNAAGADLAARV